LSDLVVVHVAAIVPKVAGEDRLIPARRYAHTSKHWLKRHSKVLELVGRLGEAGDATIAIERPFAVEVSYRPLIDDLPGIQCVLCYGAAALSPVPVQSNPIEVNHDSITSDCAFDVERPGQRIASRRPVYATLVHAASIDGLGVDSVAGKDPESGGDRR